MTTWGSRVWLLRGPLMGLLLSVGLLVWGIGWIWQQASQADVSALQRERYRFSLFQVKSALESGLRLGNALADLGQVSGTLDDWRQRQPDVLSVDVSDASGQVVFSTDPRGAGLALPSPWLQPCLSAQNTTWQTTDADGGLQCIAVVNAFGQPAGVVWVRYRTGDPMSGTLSEPLNTPAIWVTALAVLAIVTTALWRAARPLADTAQAWAEQLDTVGTRTGSLTLEGASRTPPSAAPSAMDAACHSLVRHHQWLQATDAEADQLDRQEAA